MCNQLIRQRKTCCWQVARQVRDVRSQMLLQAYLRGLVRSKVFYAPAVTGKEHSTFTLTVRYSIALAINYSRLCSVSQM